MGRRKFRWCLRAGPGERAGRSVPSRAWGCGPATGGEGGGTRLGWQVLCLTCLSSEARVMAHFNTDTPSEQSCEACGL